MCVLGERGSFFRLDARCMISCKAARVVCPTLMNEKTG